MAAPLLYQHSLFGAGTEEVVSLTGHIAAIADAHWLTPRAMLIALDKLGNLGLSRSVRWIAQRGRTINAYGNMQRRVLDELIRLTSQPELEQTCLGRLAPAFAGNGVGATKLHRHWCPTCFAVAEIADEPAVDLLAWQICEIAVCIRDFTPLVWQCPNCSEYQDFVPAKGTLHICSRCGASLAARSSSAPTFRPGTLEEGYQRWLCKVISELLRDRAQLRSGLTGTECSSFLRTLATVRGVTVESLATQVQMPLDTLMQWSRRRSRPTLASWLRFCANVNVSPSLTLADPVKAALQLPLPIPSARIYRATRGRPKPHHSGVAIRSAVLNQLASDSPGVSSVKELAAQLGVPVGSIYFHARKEVMALAARLLRQAEAERSRKRKNIERRASAAVGRLRRQGEPITRRAVVRILTRRGDCGIRKGKLFASKAIRNLRTQLLPMETLLPAGHLH